MPVACLPVPTEWPGKGDGEDLDTRLTIFENALRLSGLHALPLFSESSQFNSNDSVHHQRQQAKTSQIRDRRGDKTPGTSARFSFDPSNNYYPRNQGDPDYTAGDGNAMNFIRRVGGIDSGIQASDQARMTASDAMDIGELYLVGGNVYRLTSISPEPVSHWITSTKEKRTHTLERVDEYSMPGFQYRYVFGDGPTKIQRSDRTTPLQQVAIANIATTRPVDMVEIGIKSTVWNQVSGFPNVNILDQDRINNFAKDGATYSLGSVDIYNERISFFRFQIRRVGEYNFTEVLSGSVFAIRGRNPQTIHNMIRVAFKQRNEYEFRFIPVSGNTVLNEVQQYYELYEGNLT